ncbi:MAG: hypothetical protein QOH73_2323 [Gaiellaceae bacterium]|nr:hypothetical protein [Gaiellaceae bacterium]
MLDILEHVATRTGVTRAELADAIGLPKSSASVLINGLLERRYLAIDGGRRLVLGVRAFETGSAFLRQLSVRDLARPALDALVAEFGHTCHLAVLDGRDVVYLDKADPARGAVQLVTSIGARLPAARTAVGKAQLAFLPEDEVQALFAGEPAAVVRLQAERAEVRAAGYALDRGETVGGVVCVAAPVLDHRGRPLAAIGMTYLDASAEARDAEIGPRVAAVAAELSGRIGAHA